MPNAVITSGRLGFQILVSSHRRQNSGKGMAREIAVFHNASSPPDAMHYLDILDGMK